MYIKETVMNSRFDSYQTLCLTGKFGVEIAYHFSYTKLANMRNIVIPHNFISNAILSQEVLEHEREINNVEKLYYGGNRFFCHQKNIKIEEP
jgi:hypothetical protein